MGIGKRTGITMTFRALTFVLALLFFFPPSAHAQALPKAEPERINRAISGTLQQGMQKRGFAANDHRFNNTIARATPALSAVAGSAAAITVGTVTAPAWASIALAAGVGLIVSYAVSLAVDGFINWLFNDDTIDVIQQGIPDDALVEGGPYWFYLDQIFGSNGVSVARAALQNVGATAEAICPQVLGSSEILCSGVGKYGRQFVNVYHSPSGAPANCPTGSLLNSGFCSPTTVPDGQTLENQTPQEAIEAIPDSELDKPLNPALIAALANQAWRNAANTPDYDGLPFPQSNPLTAQDAAEWIQANPDLAPTVQDFVAPNPATNPNSNPWALPSNPTAPRPTPSTPNEGTVNPNTNEPQQNLGPDPAIGAPNLEAIPTAQQIMQPIMGLLPSLKNYKATAKTGVCPRPTVELYGTHTLEAHCILIEENKETLQAAMLLAWALIALFIILSA
ncbi:MAG: hypothetical protein ACTJHW_07900 [Paenalcaligenes sp.]